MLDINRLIEEGKPVFVYNRTNRILDHYSPFVLILKDAHGKPFPVPIPATKFPFLLSGTVPPDILANSMELHDAIRKGILELVDPEEGERIMNDPMAQKAMERAMRRFQSRRKPDGNDNDTSSKRSEYAERYIPPYVETSTDFSQSDEINAVLGEKAKEAPLKVAGSKTPETLSTEAEIRPKISQIIWDVNKDPDLAGDAIVDLAAMDLTVDDLGYIINEAEVKSVVSWAKAELAKITPKKKRRGRK